MVTKVHPQLNIYIGTKLSHNIANPADACESIDELS